MKTRLVVAIAVSLVATAAFARAPDSTFETASKVTPVKSSAHDGVILGLLDCSNAIEIVLNATYDGDNTGAANNVTTYGCSTWDESGGEVVYYLNLTEPSNFTIDLIPDGCDLDLALLRECDEDVGCILVADTGTFNVAYVTGEYYFVVDGYQGAGCPFQLVTTDGSPPEVNFCDVVDDVTGDTFSGTTCGGQNLISWLGCGEFFENGLEYYYEVFMPAGSNFTADVTSTADGALWVVGSCAEPIACLAYADDSVAFGGPETITYVNDTAEDLFVYLVIDSWGTDSCGDYDLTFAASGGAVAVEGASFGAVKVHYR